MHVHEIIDNTGEQYSCATAGIMRIISIAKRIMQQMRRDHRTLALMLFAPLLLLTLMYLILDSAEQPVYLAIVQAPEDYVQRLDRFNVISVRYDSGDAMAVMRKGEVTAVVSLQRGQLTVELDGSKPGKARQALAAIEGAMAKESVKRPDLKPRISYVYGYEDLSVFDNFGSVLIGFIIFFFVFLVAGISFLQERTSGTLEKLLSTPIRRWEIVLGYLLGFGFFAAVQAFIITLFCLHVLQVILVGSFLLVVLIVLAAALMALTLGLALSTAAGSEFQMMQFIPIVVIPQVFFSGLFDLSPAMDAIGRFMPLYYVADALRTVMMKGGGLEDIYPSLGIMFCMSLIFVLLNIRLLKRHRTL